MSISRRLYSLLAAGATTLSLLACHRNMSEQPKFLPDQQSFYFPDVPADRQPPEHTVPRGPVNDGSAFYTGKAGGLWVAALPVPVTLALVQHGQEVFDINCAACHGRDGYGQGMVVQRGFPPPPSFHSERLRIAPVGHYFDVITHGYGVMYPFGSRIPASDRWAIISYIRALQFSQNAPVDRIEPEDRTQLEKLK